MGRRSRIQLRLTHQGLKVLKLFLEHPEAEFAGADLMRDTGLASGTLYPLLLRFERGGLLDSRWEHGAPSKLGRPRRRLYLLTAAGAAVARQALSELVVQDTIMLDLSKAAPEW